jgi:hypothetical protein
MESRGRPREATRVLILFFGEKLCKYIIKIYISYVFIADMWSFLCLKN